MGGGKSWEVGCLGGWAVLGDGMSYSSVSLFFFFCCITTNFIQKPIFVFFCCFLKKKSHYELACQPTTTLSSTW